MSLIGLIENVAEELDRDATETRSEEAEKIQPKLDQIAETCADRLQKAQEREKSDPKHKDLPSPPV